MPRLLEDELNPPAGSGTTNWPQTALPGGKICWYGRLIAHAPANYFLATPAFQSDDGRFDQDLYLYAVRNQGYTSATFLEMLKDDLLIEQYVRGFVASGFVHCQKLDLLASITEQQRDYYY